MAKVPVYHRIKYVSHDIHSLDPLAEHVVDSIHVELARHDKYGNVVPGRFDTAVINFHNGGDAGVKGMSDVRFDIYIFTVDIGYCAGRIRCIFTLPPAHQARWFPGGFAHKHLAYVEWFIPFSTAAFDRDSKLYKLLPYLERGERQCSIVPVSLIRQSVHLFPKFGCSAPVAWKSSNVLDEARIFYANPFSDRFCYSTLY